jgi:hypothetical protein
VRTTEGVIQHHFSPPAYVPTQHRDAMSLWGCLQEREGPIQRRRRKEVFNATEVIYIPTCGDRTAARAASPASITSASTWIGW